MCELPHPFGNVFQCMCGCVSVCEHVRVFVCDCMSHVCRRLQKPDEVITGGSEMPMELNLDLL